MKKFYLLTFALLFGSLSILSAQNVSLETYGVSPRDVEDDEADIFDRAYNGLLNVGVETQMYLMGSADTTLVGPVWTVESAPVNSTSDFSAPFVVDTATQVVVFTPDSIGQYVIQFASNGQTATVTINAGTYLGVTGPNSSGNSCGLCHSDKVTEWETTGHSDMLVRGLNGTLSDHYSGSCISCHTTGYDADAANDGFDDFGFVYPDSADLVDNYGSPDGHLFEGVYDSALIFYPDAMLRANIQCESCHGPGSEHNGNTSDSRMVANFNAATCAYCHDDGTHHYFPEQWDVSVHASGNHLYAQGGSRDRSSCMPCHNGVGFVDALEGNEQTNTELTPITCATCHDPHSAENPHQLRTVDPVTLPDGVTVVDGGYANLCMECHNSRRDHMDRILNGNPEPHHGPQAEIIFGVNLPTFGKTLPSSAHMEIENVCIACHMAATSFDSPTGGHTFNVSYEGVDNVSACAPCHGDIGTDFGDKKYFINGNADHDGNGTAEGLQHEVEGMLEELALMLHPVGTSEVDGGDDAYTYTLSEKMAIYNWYAVEEDRSLGVHNPAFVVALLKTSIQAIENLGGEGDIAAIDDIADDFGSQVSIIWNKFVDDGVAADPIETYIVKRDDGAEGVWTTVAELSADGSARYAAVVPTITDADSSTFKIVALTQGGVTYESAAAKGKSIKNLVPQAPSNLVADMTNNKDISLTWESPEPRDPKDQIKYYNVYRSLTEGFTPTDDDLISTTTDLEFAESLTEVGSYYYKIAGVDFAGNTGALSDEVMVEIISSLGENGVPMEFALQQNYPNPFNPSTQIEFSLLKGGHVYLAVYNTIGQHVATVVDEQLEAGFHTANFNATDFSSGVYFYRITVTTGNTVEFQDINKMVLMK